MTGKWTRDIADYMAWSLRYQLWVTDKVFGRLILRAHDEAKLAERHTPIVKNLMADLPDEFTSAQLRAHFVTIGKKAEAATPYLRTQVHRGNLHRLDETHYRKTERFKERYE